MGLKLAISDVPSRQLCPLHQGPRPTIFEYAGLLHFNKWSLVPVGLTPPFKTLCMHPPNTRRWPNVFFIVYDAGPILTQSWPEVSFCHPPLASLTCVLPQEPGRIEYYNICLCRHFGSVSEFQTSLDVSDLFK